MRSVSIIEDEEGVQIIIKHTRQIYEFETWEQAIEALPNLPGLEP